MRNIALFANLLTHAIQNAQIRQLVRFNCKALRITMSVEFKNINNRLNVYLSRESRKVYISDFADMRACNKPRYVGTSSAGSAKCSAKLRPQLSW